VGARAIIIIIMIIIIVIVIIIIRKAGKICKATCEDGFSGEPSATCRTDGKWGAVNGTCDKVGEQLSFVPQFDARVAHYYSVMRGSSLGGECSKQ
jgi:hypothetical protein